MKITRLGPVRAVSTTSTLGGGGGGIDGGTGTGGSTMPPGSGTVPTATGSNTWAWASNVGAITANGSNAVLGPFVNFNGGTGVTISVSSNTLTFAASGATGSSLPWFDVKQTYGAVANGVTDDTTAVQNAMNAAEAAGGGVVYFRLGKYKIAGALQDTGRSNAQLLFPRINTSGGEQISIYLLGEVQPPAIPYISGASVDPDNGPVILSTLAAGTGAVMGAWGPLGSSDDFSLVRVVMENLTIRTVADPTNSAVDLSHVEAAELRNVTIDAGEYTMSSISQQTTSTSYGLKLPANNNGASTILDGSVNIVGFYNGILTGEHTVNAGETAVWAARKATTFPAANHASRLGRWAHYHCQRGLVFTGAHYFTVDQLNIEHASSGTFVPVYDVDDASNLGFGHGAWHTVLQGVGPDTTFLINGGSNQYWIQIGSNPYSAAFATPAIVLGTASATGAATTVIRSDSTIVAFDATVPTTQAFGDSAATGSVAFAARRDHVHGMPADPGTSSGGHAHVVSEAHLSNGSATTYTLDQYFEPGSVIAWNTTTLARLGVTETLPDQATVSAAGTTGDTIQFDYAATLS